MRAAGVIRGVGTPRRYVRERMATMELPEKVRMDCRVRGNDDD